MANNTTIFLPFVGEWFIINCAYAQYTPYGVIYKYTQPKQ